MDNENREIFKAVDGHDKYEVSSYGRVRRISTGRIMKQQKHKETREYLRVGLDKKIIRVHRLVAFAFIPNPNNYPAVDHIDGNGGNNEVRNLRWCTNTMNNANRKKNINGTTSQYKGVYMTTYKSGAVRYIATIAENGKKKHLGTFKTEKEAAIVYNKKALELWGEFAKLNVIV